MLQKSLEKERAIVTDYFTDNLILSSRKQRKPLREIALEYNFHPTTFSRIINKIETVEKNDERIIRLAKHMELDPEKCFG